MQQLPEVGRDEVKRARDRESARLYALRHPDRIKAKYQKRREHYLEYGREWRKANPGYNREWKRADRAKNPAKWLEREHRRKALKRGVYVEEVNRRKVFERDGWVCGICSEPVDRTVKAPHPRSVSLDHIVPLSKGGEHSYANVQCAHFWCNAVKSDRELDLRGVSVRNFRD